MLQGPETGWASSAQVYQCSHDLTRWNWNASGRYGMTSGSAATEAQAWVDARGAQAELNRQMTPRGMG